MLTLDKIEINPSDHIGLAHTVARQFVDKKQRVEDSDEYAEACLCLVEAAKSYTTECGTFSGYAWKKMRNGIIQRHRHRNRKKRKGTVESDASLESVEAKVESVPLPEDLVYRLLEDGPGDTRQQRGDRLLLIETYLGQGRVQDIANRLGVHRERVYQRIRRAIKAIRERHAKLLEQYETYR